MHDSYQRELLFTLELSREVADLARSRSGSVKPQEKANLSYVTDLDHDLERLIRDRIGADFPDDELTGEEYAASGGGGVRKWSIDPIDGTGNLVQGLPLWAVSIGLLDRGEPVLGVIVIPPLNETYWAIKGEGAFRDGEPIACAPDADFFHDQDNVCVNTNALRQIDPRTISGRIRVLGSCCCELVFVACGRLVSTTHLGEQLHDVAAGVVIASEAGCAFGKMDGGTMTAAEVVASTPILEPLFVAPRRRLAALQRGARRLA
jgi:myo-inositol-1(or 4)-monophosphatase